MKTFIFIRTLISYFLFLLATPFVMVPALIIAALPTRYRFYTRLFFILEYWLYKVALHFTFNSLCICGKENIPRDTGVIFVANHQSAMDIPVVGLICGPQPHIWLALEYYVNTPILGFFIKRMFVPVNRESKTKAAQSLIQILRLLKEKRQHLIIFPEGARFTDGKIHEFFKGFAVIAKKTGLPVVPIYMPNNGKIYPPYSFLIHKYPIIAHIGKPFYFSDSDTEETFTQQVQEWFVKEVEQNV